MENALTARDSLMDHEQDVLFEVKRGIGGNVGCILLNRPQALNALTETMCTQIDSHLQAWDEDEAIKAVIIRGEGKRAFCAGGDIRQLYLDRDTAKQKPNPFFQIEYQMNTRLHHFSKPYFAFLDGIVMGGGMGISIHGSHRIATERLKMAMPETGIGFFPDVGGGYFLTRCPHKIGWYLGLTGNLIHAADALQAGLATHIISSDRLDELEQTIIETHFTNNFDAIDRLLTPFSVPMSNTKIWQHRQDIAFWFDTDNVEEIFLRLEAAQSDFAHQTLDDLLHRSPTSLKVTLAHLNRSQTLRFDEIIQTEYKIAQQFLQNPDFYEGIRAALIDKDQQPNWQPDRISKVPTATIDTFLE